jgi:SAM-dependent methyltransferase
MFFTFHERARWNAERQAVEFGVEIGKYRGVVRVPRRVFQRLLPEPPMPERCIEAYYLQRTRFESITERRLRRRQLTAGTSRSGGGSCQRHPVETVPTGEERLNSNPLRTFRAGFEIETHLRADFPEWRYATTRVKRGRSGDTRCCGSRWGVGATSDVRSGATVAEFWRAASGGILMSAAEEIYEAMRNSGMVNWVGPGDPAAIGGYNFTSIAENLPLRGDHVLFDFGCGIGRTSVKLAEFLTEGGQLVGSDIVPGQLQFCRQQFEHRFPNATFHCIKSGNPQYNDLITATQNATPAIDEGIFFSQYRDAFDITVAFSVFTHFDPTMAAHYLRSLRDVTKPSGHLFLTWFLDHPSNPAQFNGIPTRLGIGQNFSDPQGNLLLALFSPAAVAELAASAGLLIERVSYGRWRGGAWPFAPLMGQHAQDIVILRRALPEEFDANTYLEIHKDVAAAGADPVQHYLTYGYREGRRLR